MKSRRYPSVGRIYCPPAARAELDFIYNEIFRDRAYLQHGVTLQPGDTIFDVGANVGLFALFVARECRQQLTLYCFEPIPETFRLLQLNLARLQGHSAAHVHLFNQGLAARDDVQSTEFQYFPGAPGNSTMFPREKAAIFQHLVGDRSELMKRLIEYNPWRLPAPRIVYRLLSPFISRRLKQVETTFREFQSIRGQLTTMAVVCREHAVSSIDLLKVDVEGPELEVLEGMDDRAWAITRQIVLEVHDVDGRLARIKALLETNGFLEITVVKPTWAEVFDLNAYTVYARR